MRLKTILAAVLGLVVLPLSAAEYDPNDLWLVKTYGGYRVKVYRVLADHSTDYVQVEVFEVTDKGKRKTKKVVDLPTPGYQGYVRDVTFTPMEKNRIAITFSVEMKIPQGVTINHVFVMNPEGRYKELNQLRLADPYGDF